MLPNDNWYDQFYSAYNDDDKENPERVSKVDEFDVPDNFEVITGNDPLPGDRYKTDKGAVTGVTKGSVTSQNDCPPDKPAYNRGKMMCYNPSDYNDMGHPEYVGKSTGKKGNADDFYNQLATDAADGNSFAKQEEYIMNDGYSFKPFETDEEKKDRYGEQFTYGNMGKSKNLGIYDETEEDIRLGLNVSDLEYRDEARYRNQSGWEVAGRAWERFYKSVFYKTAAGIGGIFDFEDHNNTDDEVGNWLTNWATENEEAMKLDNEIYTSKDSSWTSASWLAKNGSDLFASVGSFIIQGMITGGVLSGVSKALQLKKLLSLGKTVRGLNKVDDALAGVASAGAKTTGKFNQGYVKLTDWASDVDAFGKLKTGISAVLLNQSESILSATPVFNDTYKQAIAAGHSDEYARQVAAHSASTVISANRANFLLNLTSVNSLFKASGQTLRSRAADLSFKGFAKKTGFEIIQESAEEAGNALAEAKGKMVAADLLDSGDKKARPELDYLIDEDRGAMGHLGAAIWGLTAAPMIDAIVGGYDLTNAAFGARTDGGRNLFAELDYDEFIEAMVLGAVGGGITTVAVEKGYKNIGGNENSWFKAGSGVKSFLANYGIHGSKVQDVFATDSEYKDANGNPLYKAGSKKYEVEDDIATENEKYKEGTVADRDLKIKIKKKVEGQPVSSPQEKIDPTDSPEGTINKRVAKLAENKDKLSEEQQAKLEEIIKTKHVKNKSEDKLGIAAYIDDIRAMEASLKAKESENKTETTGETPAVEGEKKNDTKVEPNSGMSVNAEYEEINIPKGTMLTKEMVENLEAQGILRQEAGKVKYQRDALGLLVEKPKGPSGRSPQDPIEYVTAQKFKTDKNGNYIAVYKKNKFGHDLVESANKMERRLIEEMKIKFEPQKEVFKKQMNANSRTAYIQSVERARSGLESLLNEQLTEAEERELKIATAENLATIALSMKTNGTATKEEFDAEIEKQLLRLTPENIEATAELELESLGKVSFSKQMIASFDDGTTEELEMMLDEIINLKPEKAKEQGYNETYKEDAKKIKDTIKIKKSRYKALIKRHGHAIGRSIFLAEEKQEFLVERAKDLGNEIRKETSDKVNSLNKGLFNDSGTHNSTLTTLVDRLSELEAAKQQELERASVEIANEITPEERAVKIKEVKDKIYDKKYNDEKNKLEKKIEKATEEESNFNKKNATLIKSKQEKEAALEKENEKVKAAKKESDRLAQEKATIESEVKKQSQDVSDKEAGFANGTVAENDLKAAKKSLEKVSEELSNKTKEADTAKTNYLEVQKPAEKIASELKEVKDSLGEEGEVASKNLKELLEKKATLEKTAALQEEKEVGILNAKSITVKDRTQSLHDEVYNDEYKAQRKALYEKQEEINAEIKQTQAELKEAVENKNQAGVSVSKNKIENLQKRMQEEVRDPYEKLEAEKDREFKEKISNTIDVKIQARKKEILDAYSQKEAEAFEKANENKDSDFKEKMLAKNNKDSVISEAKKLASIKARKQRFIEKGNEIEREIDALINGKETANKQLLINHYKRQEALQRLAKIKFFKDRHDEAQAALELFKKENPGVQTDGSATYKGVRFVEVTEDLLEDGVPVLDEEGNPLQKVTYKKEEYQFAVNFEEDANDSSTGRIVIVDESPKIVYENEELQQYRNVIIPGKEAEFERIVTELASINSEISASWNYYNKAKDKVTTLNIEINGINQKLLTETNEDVKSDLEDRLVKINDEITILNSEKAKLIKEIKESSKKRSAHYDTKKSLLYYNIESKSKTEGTDYEGFNVVSPYHKKTILFSNAKGFKLSVEKIGKTPKLSADGKKNVEYDYDTESQYDGEYELEQNDVVDALQISINGVAVAQLMKITKEDNKSDSVKDRLIRSENAERGVRKNVERIVNQIKVIDSMSDIVDEATIEKNISKRNELISELKELGVENPQSIFELNEKKEEIVNEIVDEIVKKYAQNPDKFAIRYASSSISTDSGIVQPSFVDNTTIIANESLSDKQALLELEKIFQNSNLKSEFITKARNSIIAAIKNMKFDDDASVNSEIVDAIVEGLVTPGKSLKKAMAENDAVRIAVEKTLMANLQVRMQTFDSYNPALFKLPKPVTSLQITPDSKTEDTVVKGNLNSASSKRAIQTVAEYFDMMRKVSTLSPEQSVKNAVKKRLINLLTDRDQRAKKAIDDAAIQDDKDVTEFNNLLKESNEISRNTSNLRNSNRLVIDAINKYSEEDLLEIGFTEDEVKELIKLREKGVLNEIGDSFDTDLLSGILEVEKNNLERRKQRIAKLNKDLRKKRKELAQQEPAIEEYMTTLNENEESFGKRETKLLQAIDQLQMVQEEIDNLTYELENLEYLIEEERSELSLIIDDFQNKIDILESEISNPGNVAYKAELQKELTELKQSMNAAVEKLNASIQENQDRIDSKKSELKNAELRKRSRKSLVTKYSNLSKTAKEALDKSEKNVEELEKIKRQIQNIIAEIKEEKQETANDIKELKKRIANHKKASAKLITKNGKISIAKKISELNDQISSQEALLKSFEALSSEAAINNINAIYKIAAHNNLQMKQLGIDNIDEKINEKLSEAFAKVNSTINKRIAEILKQDLSTNKELVEELENLRMLKNMILDSQKIPLSKRAEMTMKIISLATKTPLILENQIFQNYAASMFESVYLIEKVNVDGEYFKSIFNSLIEKSESIQKNLNSKILASKSEAAYLKRVMAASLQGKITYEDTKEKSKRVEEIRERLAEAIADGNDLLASSLEEKLRIATEDLNSSIIYVDNVKNKNEDGTYANEIQVEVNKGFLETKRELQAVLFGNLRAIEKFDEKTIIEERNKQLAEKRKNIDISRQRIKILSELSGNIQSILGNVENMNKAELDIAYAENDLSKILSEMSKEKEIFEKSIVDLEMFNRKIRSMSSYLYGPKAQPFIDKLEKVIEKDSQSNLNAILFSDAFGVSNSELVKQLSEDIERAYVMDSLMGAMFEASVLRGAKKDSNEYFIFNKLSSYKKVDRLRNSDPDFYNQVKNLMRVADKINSIFRFKTTGRVTEEHIKEILEEAGLDPDTSKNFFSEEEGNSYFNLEDLFSTVRTKLEDSMFRIFKEKDAEIRKDLETSLNNATEVIEGADYNLDSKSLKDSILERDSVTGKYKILNQLDSRREKFDEFVDAYNGIQSSITSMIEEERKIEQMYEDATSPFTRLQTVYAVAELYPELANAIKKLARRNNIYNNLRVEIEKIEKDLEGLNEFTSDVLTELGSTGDIQFEKGAKKAFLEGKKKSLIQDLSKVLDSNFSVLKSILEKSESKLITDILNDESLDETAKSQKIAELIDSPFFQNTFLQEVTKLTENDLSVAEIMKIQSIYDTYAKVKSVSSKGVEYAKILERKTELLSGAKSYENLTRLAGETNDYKAKVRTAMVLAKDMTSVDKMSSADWAITKMTLIKEKESIEKAISTMQENAVSGINNVIPNIIKELEEANLDFDRVSNQAASLKEESKKLSELVKAGSVLEINLLREIINTKVNLAHHQFLNDILEGKTELTADEFKMFTKKINDIVSGLFNQKSEFAKKRNSLEKDLSSANKKVANENSPKKFLERLDEIKKAIERMNTPKFDLRNKMIRASQNEIDEYVEQIELMNELKETTANNRVVYGEKDAKDKDELNHRLNHFTKSKEDLFTTSNYEDRLHKRPNGVAWQKALQMITYSDDSQGVYAAFVHFDMNNALSKAIGNAKEGDKTLKAIDDEFVAKGMPRNIYTVMSRKGSSGIEYAVLTEKNGQDFISWKSESELENLEKGQKLVFETISGKESKNRKGYNSFEKIYIVENTYDANTDIYIEKKVFMKGQKITYNQLRQNIISNYYLLNKEYMANSAKAGIYSFTNTANKDWAKIVSFGEAKKAGTLPVILAAITENNDEYVDAEGNINYEAYMQIPFIATVIKNTKNQADKENFIALVKNGVNIYNEYMMKVKSELESFSRDIRSSSEITFAKVKSLRIGSVKTSSNDKLNNITDLFKDEESQSKVNFEIVGLAEGDDNYYSRFKGLIRVKYKGLVMPGYTGNVTNGDILATIKLMKKRFTEESMATKKDGKTVRLYEFEYRSEDGNSVGTVNKNIIGLDHDGNEGIANSLMLMQYPKNGVLKAHMLWYENGVFKFTVQTGVDSEGKYIFTAMTLSRADFEKIAASNSEDSLDSLLKDISSSDNLKKFITAMKNKKQNVINNMNSKAHYYHPVLENGKVILIRYNNYKEFLIKTNRVKVKAEKHDVAELQKYPTASAYMAIENRFVKKEDLKTADEIQAEITEKRAAKRLDNQRLNLEEATNKAKDYVKLNTISELEYLLKELESAGKSSYEYLSKNPSVNSEYDTLKTIIEEKIASLLANAKKKPNKKAPVTIDNTNSKDKIINEKAGIYEKDGNIYLETKKDDSDSGEFIGESEGNHWDVIDEMQSPNIVDRSSKNFISNDVMHGEKGLLSKLGLQGLGPMEISNKIKLLLENKNEKRIVEIFKLLNEFVKIDSSDSSERKLTDIYWILGIQSAEENESEYIKANNEYFKSIGILDKNGDVTEKTLNALKEEFGSELFGDDENASPIHERTVDNMKTIRILNTSSTVFKILIEKGVIPFKSENAYNKEYLEFMNERLGIDKENFESNYKMLNALHIASNFDFANMSEKEIMNALLERFNAAIDNDINSEGTLFSSSKKNISVKEFVESVSKKYPNKKAVAVAKEIANLDFMEDVKVDVVNYNEYSYESNTNKITLANGNSSNDLVSIATLNHELIHAVVKNAPNDAKQKIRKELFDISKSAFEKIFITNGKLDSKKLNKFISDFKSDKLEIAFFLRAFQTMKKKTKDGDDIYESLEAAFENAENEVDFKKNLEIAVKDLYANMLDEELSKSGNEEMLAYTFNSPTFVSYMNNLQSDLKGKSFLEKVLESIKSFVKEILGTKIIEGSYLDNILSVSAHLNIVTNKNPSKKEVAQKEAVETETEKEKSTEEESKLNLTIEGKLAKLDLVDDIFEGITAIEEKNAFEEIITKENAIGNSPTGNKIEIDDEISFSKSRTVSTKSKSRGPVETPSVVTKSDKLSKILSNEPIISMKLENKELKISAVELEEVVDGLIHKFMQYLRKGSGADEKSRLNADVSYLINPDLYFENNKKSGDFQNKMIAELFTEYIETVKKGSIGASEDLQKLAQAMIYDVSNIADVNRRAVIENDINEIKKQIIQKFQFSLKRFKIEYKTEENELESGREGNEYKDHYLISGYEMTDIAIKLLVNGLPAYEVRNGAIVESLSSKGFPMLVDGIKLFNTIQNITANLPINHSEISVLKSVHTSLISNYKKAIAGKKHDKIILSLIPLFLKVNGNKPLLALNETSSGGYTSHDLDNILLSQEFIQTFTKAKNDYTTSNYIDETTVEIYDSNTEASTKNVKTKWRKEISSLINSNRKDYITNLKNSIEVIESLSKDKKSDYTSEHAFEFLSKLGIEFESENTDIEKIYNLIKGVSKETSVIDFIGDIKSLALAVKKIINSKKDTIEPFEELFTNKDLNSHLNTITNLISAELHFNKSKETPQFNTPDGNTIYATNLYAEMTTVAADVNAAKTIEELYESQPQLNSSWSRNSKIIKALFNEDGSRNENNKLSIGYSMGVTTKSGIGEVTSKLSVQDKFISDINNILDSTFPFVRAADRTSDSFIKVKTIFDQNVSLINNEENVRNISEEYFIDHLIDEIMTISSADAMDNRVGNFEKNNSKFRFFDSFTIDGKKHSHLGKMHSDILAFAKKENNSRKDVAKYINHKKKQLIESISGAFAIKAANYIEWAINLGIISIDNGRLNIQGTKNFSLSFEDAKKEIAKSLAKMSMGYIEQSKLFYGDTAYYKNADDIFKRFKMFNATKKMSILPNSLLKGMNNSNYLTIDGTQFNTKDNSELIKALDSIQYKVSELDLSKLKNTSDETINKIATILEANANPTVDFGLGFRADGEWRKNFDTIVISDHEYRDAILGSWSSKDKNLKVSDISISLREGKAVFKIKGKELSSKETDSQIGYMVKDFVDGFIEDGMTSEIEITAKLQSYMSAYDSVKEADAEAYCTLPMYKTLLIASGKQWNAQLETIYKRALKGESLNNKELKELVAGGSFKGALTKLKTHGAGFLTSHGAVKKGSKKTERNYSSNESNEGTVPVFGYKHSLLPLIPSVHKPGSPLGELMKTMVKHDIQLAQFGSAVKYGQVGNVKGKTIKFYKEDGKINIEEDFEYQTTEFKYFGIQVDMRPIFKNEVTAGSQVRKLILNNMYEYGIPSDFAASIKKKTFAEGRPFDWAEATEEWNKLSNKEKGNQSEFYKQSKEYLDIQEAIYTNAYEKMKIDFGISGKNIDDIHIDNMDTFVEMVVDSMIERGKTPNEIKSVQTMLKNSPIEFISGTKSIQSLLYSIINNRVIREKRKGEGAPQAAVTGWENDGKIRNKEEASFLRTYRYNSDKSKILPSECILSLPYDLNEYVDKRGGLDAFNGEIAALREKLNRIEEGGNKKKEKLTDEENTLLKLITIVGFRIPNQGLSSTDVLRVYKFNPTEMGSTIVVPSNMTAKGGSDFDIDKLTLYISHYKVVKDRESGKLKLKSVEYSTSQDEDSKKERYNNYLKSFKLEKTDDIKDLEKNLKSLNELLKELKKEQKEIVNDYDDLVNIGITKESLEENINELESALDSLFVENEKISNELNKLVEKIDAIRISLKEEIEKAKVKAGALTKAAFVKLPIAQQNSKAALENKMIALHEDIMMHNKKMRQLLSPVSDALFKDGAIGIVWDYRFLTSDSEILKEYQEFEKTETDENKRLEKYYETKQRFVDEFEAATKEYASWNDIFDHKVNLEKFQAFLSGKTGVGIAALQNTFNTLSQMINLALNTENVFPGYIFEHNKVKIKGEEYPSFAGQTSTDGALISETISSFINAYVDVSADPFIFDINGGLYTSGTMFMILRLGASPVWVNRFLNQPGIKEYVNKIESGQSVYYKETHDGKKKSESDVLKEMYGAIIGTSTGEISFDNTFVKILSSKELRELTPEDQIKTLAKASENVYNRFKTLFGGKETLSNDDLKELLYESNKFAKMFDNEKYTVTAKGLKLKGAELADFINYYKKQLVLVDLFAMYKWQADGMRSLASIYNFDTNGALQDVASNVAKLDPIMNTNDEIKVAEMMFKNASDFGTKTVIKQPARTVKEFHAAIIDTTYFFNKLNPNAKQIIMDTFEMMQKENPSKFKTKEGKEDLLNKLIIDFHTTIVLSKGNFKMKVVNKENNRVKEINIQLDPATVFEELLSEGSKAKYKGIDGNPASLPKYINTIKTVAKTYSDNKNTLSFDLIKHKIASTLNTNVKDVDTFIKENSKIITNALTNSFINNVRPILSNSKEKATLDLVFNKTKVETDGNNYPIDYIDGNLNKKLSPELHRMTSDLNSLKSISPELYFDLMRLAVNQSGFQENKIFSMLKAFDSSDINQLLTDSFSKISERNITKIFNEYVDKTTRQDFLFYGVRARLGFDNQPMSASTTKIPTVNSVKKGNGSVVRISKKGETKIPIIGYRNVFYGVTVDLEQTSIYNEIDSIEDLESLDDAFNDIIC